MVQVPNCPEKLLYSMPWYLSLNGNSEHVAHKNVSIKNNYVNGASVDELNKFRFTLHVRTYF